MIASVLFAGFFAATFVRPLERVSSMNPWDAQSTYDSAAIQLVYEPILDIDYKARPYKIVPGYCELPEISADGLRYVFRVREMPRNAKDAVRALEHLREPTCPSGWMMKDVESFRALDEKTFEIVLKRRVRYFQWLMTMTACAVVGEDGDGTGPYKLTKWRKNHEMVFERREKVEGGFDTIRYLVVDDLSTQWLMFLKGEIDFIREVARDNWEMVVDKNGNLSEELARKGIELHTNPSLEACYTGINMRDPILGPNKKLRQALNCAFDYPAWERFNLYRIAESTGPVPPGIADRLETPFPYRFDLEKAKRLIAEAGYPGGIDPKTGRRLVLTLSIGRPDQASREAGELMASFYAKIGIKLELDFQTWDAFLKSVNEGRVQLYRLAWVADYPDPQNFLQLFYGPNASPGINHSNYVNPEFDAAYEREDFLKCQEIVREDCPWIFTHYIKTCSVTGPRVGNFVISDFSQGAEQFYEVRK